MSNRGFNTRAGKKDYVVGHSLDASKNLSGLSGKGVVLSTAGQALPDLPQNKIWNAQEQSKYIDFKSKRAESGAHGSNSGELKGGQMIDKYTKLEGEFAQYMEDPYSDAPVQRGTVSDEVEMVMIGGGFGGLLVSARLREQGFSDIILCEKGGDVGGTWYWNRYPGIACDVESYSYFPLLEELDYVPSMKFASGFEIMEYCQKLADYYGMYGNALFHTTVTKTTWNESTGRWLVETDRGDAMKSKFVVMANGILTTPKLAKIDGMQSFKGISFHSSRWNYSVDLRGKSVGIIGTGATSIQAVPELAKVVGQLYVFQRTPSSIDIREQKATDYDKVKEWKKADPNWAKSRRARQSTITSGRAALRADDDFLEGKVSAIPGGSGGVQKKRDPNAKPLSTEEINNKLLAANWKIMEQIRMRVDDVVKDPKTAAALKPYYPFGCKRPGFHDEYLPTFNLPHVHLVDTAPKGVELINEKGVVHQGQEIPLDVLIYATGFQWMGTGTFNTITGRKGETLAEKWERQGTSTFLGIHTKDFPNLMIISGPQGGGGSFNFTTALEAHGDYVVWVMKHLRENKWDIVDVDGEAEKEYVQHCYDSDVASQPLRDCVTYYNGEGTAKPGSLAYYGNQWSKRVAIAQKDLTPYLFENTGYKWDSETVKPMSRL